MNRMQEQVMEFHEHFGAPVSKEPWLPAPDRRQLRWDMIFEENNELLVALTNKDITATADALGDLLYVIFGAALEFGLDMEPIVDEIHRSNMTKLGADGNPLLREDGKILKGPLYDPPSFVKILSEVRK